MDKPFEIVLEHPEFLAVNKFPGLLVHPTPVSREKTLSDFLAEKYPEIRGVGDDPGARPGIVHRLDRDTSGILIVARTQKFFSYLKKMFQNGEVKKTYLALVHGRMEEKGSVDLPIGLKSGTTKRSTRGNPKMVKPARTQYELAKEFDMPSGAYSLVRLFPKTGRTHQLRVHMNAIHRPVVGDQMYGKQENPWGVKRQLLHAESIEFPSPDGSRMRLEADVPEDFRRVLESLR